MAIGTDVAVPRPSWVSYAAQTRLARATPHFVPAVAGEGGLCDPDALESAVCRPRPRPGRFRAVVATIPGQPDRPLASPDSVRALCAVAERHDLIIISDEIYRDLVHDPGAPFLSPAAVAPVPHGGDHGPEQEPGPGRLADRRGAAPRRTARAGPDRAAARCGPARSGRPRPSRSSTRRLVGFREPPEITERIARSRSPARGGRPRRGSGWGTAAGLSVPAPQAAFYLYPDFSGWRGSAAAARHRDRRGPGRPTWSSGTGQGRCRPAPSASGRRTCGSGWPPACCTGTPTTSGRRRWPRRTRWPCRGSRRRWPGSRTCWPTSARDHRAGTAGRPGPPGAGRAGGRPS